MDTKNWSIGCFRLLLAAEKKSYTIREIAKISGCSEVTAYQTVKTLMADGICIKEKTDGVVSYKFTKILRMEDTDKPEPQAEPETPKADEKKKSKKIAVDYSGQIHEIMSYLNRVTGKNFREVESNKNLIRPKLKEGYSVDDFKRVIDVKTKEWQATDMKIYLRPQTLFGSKFDSYLNQNSGTQSRSDELAGNMNAWQREREKEAAEYYAQYGNQPLPF